MPSRARRVLIYVLNSGNLYGTERMALATVAGLTDYTERVVFAPPATTSGSVLDAARTAGHATAVFRTRRQFTRALVPWLLRYRHVDIIGTGVGQSYIGYALSLLLGVRLKQIQVAHGGTDAWHSYGLKRPLNRIPVVLVAVSEYVRDKLVEHGIRKDRVRVIENFIPEGPSGAPTRPPFDPSQPGSLPLDGRQVRVALVSRIDRIKRIDLVVDAVADGGLDDFVFDIYGTGEELGGLRARAAGHPQLHFHGFATDVPQRLSRADFLLHLCPEEPFGLVVLEAFLARVVVIVPDAGGTASIVEDGVTGLKFRADDVHDLRRVLLKASALEPSQLQRLVENAADSLRSRFSPAEGTRRYREALT